MAESPCTIKPDNQHQTVELSQAVEHVEQTLFGVLSSIQRLNEESEAAKEEIRACFGRQLGNLHTRETQLLRQVDVIFRARREALQKQLAHCYRTLGSLETSRKWTEEIRKHKCIVALDRNEFEGMKKWGVLNPLNWTLEEDVLSKAIASFGKVDMDGVLLLPNEEQSKCLPASVEEYFEEDQQVLNKPLNTKVHIIDIKFPKLPAKDGGAARSSDEKSDTNYGPYRKGTSSYKPCDVQTWLGCIQSEIAAEPMEDVTETMPEMSNLSDTGSVGSKESDSIEIVSITNLCLKSSSESSSTCPLNPTNDTEIENLADTFSACLKSDKSDWLYVSDQKKLPEIPIAKACRANSICDSYESCVCDVNCAETAKRNRMEKERQNDNKKWLWNHTAITTNVTTTPIFPSIFPDGDDNKRWLVSSPMQVAMPNASIKTPSAFPDLVFDVDNKKKWLQQTSASQLPSPVTTNVLQGVFSNDDNTAWLIPASPLPSKPVNTPVVFPPQFWDGDLSKWLHPDTLRGLASSKSANGTKNNCGIGSGSFDSGKESNNMWLTPGFDRTIAEALDEIKSKKFVLNQLKF